jgi:NAD(P)H-hydrate epimerase
MMQLKKELYHPPKESHKGQNGRLLIIGGSRQYHGAAIFAIMAARRFVDLIYFYPGARDPLLLGTVKDIPEAIIIDDLNILPHIDAVLFGVGFGKAKFDVTMLDRICGKHNQLNQKLVVDGDGLDLIKNKIPKGAVLTPHEGEFQDLFGMPGTKDNVRKMAREHKCIVLKKGAVDFVSDGKELYMNKTGNPGMTKGGTGDVLAGLVAALACKNDAFEAACVGAYVNGLAGNLLMRKYGYNFCASDLAGALAEAFVRFEKH